MTHRIMIAALYGDARRTGPSYYCAQGLQEKTLYCDAFLPMEASCKYVLSAFPIDEIIVLGKKESDLPEDEAPAVLRQVKKDYRFDSEKTSEYSILLYRLMQFFDEIRIEDADQHSLLSGEEQKETVAFLRRFFREYAAADGDRKISRYFHYLIQDAALREEFVQALDAWLPDPERDRERYMAWIVQYLYRELKATSKMEPLEQNENVRIRYLCAVEDDSLSLLSKLLPLFQGMEYDDGTPDTTELTVCVHNDQASRVFDMLNAMNLSKILPSSRVRISRVVTEAQMSGLPVRVLRDQTEEYGISELLSATGAFLSYGKTDLLVQYWESANRRNPQIERVLYAMRNIDSGISLCDIADLERGVRSLRDVIQNDLPISGDSIIERYFGLVVDSIRQDYGSLLEGDTVPFIDLVRWAYRKGFLQQTLTLIESRAPRDFVDRGIYFYADGERTRKHALEILGQIYYDLKPHEKYKLDDVSHYYVKYYSRRRAPRADGDAYQLGYAAVRMEELDTRDESLIRAQTVCPDRAALKDLLFAYYHLGDVRNQTNHATEEFSGFYTVTPESDPGERRKLITQAIDYFLHCYDTVCGLISGKNAHVVKLETAELADYASALRSGNRRDRDRSSDAPAAAPGASAPNAKEASGGADAVSANGQDGKSGWREFK